MGTPPAAKRTGKASAPFWERWTPQQRVVAVLAVVAVGVLARFDKVVEPFARGFALSSQIVRDEQELKRLREQHTAVTTQMAELKTPEGIALEIRETLGQVKPGEYPLRVIVRPPSARTPAKPVPFMRAQGLDMDSVASAIHDTMTGAVEVFVKWAGVGRPRPAEPR